MKQCLGVWAKQCNVFGCLGFGAGSGYDATIISSRAFFSVLALEAFSAGYDGERKHCNIGKSMNVNIATLVNV